MGSGGTESSSGFGWHPPQPGLAARELTRGQVWTGPAAIHSTVPRAAGYGVRATPGSAPRRRAPLRSGHWARSRRARRDNGHHAVPPAAVRRDGASQPPERPRDRLATRRSKHHSTQRRSASIAPAFSSLRQRRWQHQRFAQLDDLRDTLPVDPFEAQQFSSPRVDPNLLRALDQMVDAFKGDLENIVLRIVGDPQKG